MKEEVTLKFNEDFINLKYEPAVVEQRIYDEVYLSKEVQDAIIYAAVQGK